MLDITLYLCWVLHCMLDIYIIVGYCISVVTLEIIHLFNWEFIGLCETQFCGTNSLINRMIKCFIYLGVDWVISVVMLIIIESHLSSSLQFCKKMSFCWIVDKLKASINLPFQVEWRLIDFYQFKILRHKYSDWVTIECHGYNTEFFNALKNSVF